MNSFLQEFCAPVVVVTSTGESESICLQNGLLLHEMLSAFGSLGGINATIRASSANFHITDAHIRFERETEVKSKTSQDVENQLKANFEEFDLHRMPSTIAELQSSTPSAWTPSIEQIVMRSMSFSEFEMISQPLILMTVVSTSDMDPVACMQQLASIHHTPQSILSGQYDPDVHRVYLLIHDAQNAAVGMEANTIYKKLISAGFPQQHTKFLTLNSLPEQSPNLQQPDMWSRWIIPKYYPADAPTVDTNIPPATNPIDGTRVLGSRLSMEDFMALRDFCIAFFHKEVIPALEKRVSTLTKLVNETRKGMRNVLKSFWRKPREESSTKGGVRYRYDRIETQILLLADASFIIRDYETASSMYKLVKDDYKSDKSNLHLAHTLLMLAASQMMIDGRQGKEVGVHLEGLREAVAMAAPEPAHIVAYFALLAGDMYLSASRTPLIAAEFLLQAAACVSRFPLMCAVLTERAASYFLQGGLTRKYALRSMLAGHKMHPTCPRARRHSLVCFAAALIVHESGSWCAIKSKLCRAIMDELKGYGAEGGRRALLFLLRMLQNAVGSRSLGGKESMKDAANVLAELLKPGPWGAVTVDPSWLSSSTRDLLIGPLPMTERSLLPAGDETNGSGTLHTVLRGGLSVPSLLSPSLAIMVAQNGGLAGLMPHDASPGPDAQAAEELRVMLALEKAWGVEVEAAVSMGAQGLGFSSKTLAERWVAAEHELRSASDARKLGSQIASVPRIPLGERVVVRLKFENKLPYELLMTNLHLNIGSGEPDQSAEHDPQTEPTDIVLSPASSKELLLSALPRRTGTYCAESVQWCLSPHLRVMSKLQKPGPLLHKSLSQRAAHERAPPVIMSFEVTEPHPLLAVSMRGIGPDVLQGELIKASLSIRNEGHAPACEIDLKFSQPVCLILSGGSVSNGQGQKVGAKSEIVAPWGQSSTAVRLPAGTVIPPNSELNLDCWLRFNLAGWSTISVLVSFAALVGDLVVPFGPGQRCRTATHSVHVSVQNSVVLHVNVVDLPSSTTRRTLVLTLGNALSSKDTSTHEDGNNMPSDRVHIEGIFVLGAAQPIPLNDITAAHAKSAAPSECITMCLPVDLCGPGHSEGSATWALSPPNGSPGADASFLSVVTRTLCSLYATVRLHRMLKVARAAHREASAGDTAPRTVQQVRRDQAKIADKAEPLTPGSGSSNDFINGTPESPPERERTSSHSFSAAPSWSLASCSGVPVTALDLAALESSSNSVNVTVLWACKWKGVVRRGIHSISQVPMHTGVGMGTTITSKPSKADDVIVGVTHPGRATLQGSGNSRARVPVTVELRSVASERMLVTIIAESSMEPHGVQWEGKTSHVNLVLDAHGVITLDFYATMTRRGVYDLKKFSIAVSPVHGQNGAVKKVFTDNSFIIVE